MTYYKITAKGARSAHGGDLVWPRPRGKRPGKWVEVQGPIVLCRNGLHVVTADHILDWACEEVWAVEIGGTIIDDGRKVVASRARLLRLVMDEDALRHLAVAYAARVLPIFERKRPDDLRVRECLVACGTGGAAAKAAWVAEAAEAARAARAAEAAKAAWVAEAAEATEAVGAPRAARAAKAAWVAEAAERRWQRRTLRKYLAGKVDLTRPVKLPPHPKGAAQ